MRSETHANENMFLLRALRISCLRAKLTFFPFQIEHIASLIIHRRRPNHANTRFLQSQFTLSFQMRARQRSNSCSTFSCVCLVQNNK